MAELLTVSDFCRAVISELVIRGVRVIEPKSITDRQGFARIVMTLDHEIEHLRERHETGSPWYRSLVRLRNSLQPSNNGSFENFETVLRDLQTSTLQYPNPDYIQMKFELSRPHAESILKAMGTQQRAIARAAAEAFAAVQAA